MILQVVVSRIAVSRIVAKISCRELSCRDLSYSLARAPAEVYRNPAAAISKLTSDQKILTDK